MNIEPCPLFAFLIVARQVWRPWVEESTTVLAADEWRASLIAFEMPRMKGCRITHIERR